MNKFEEFFWNENKKCIIHKWHHYFEIYECYTSKFNGTSPKILEIGLWKGGSLEMWNYYFNNNCQIYGIDIDKTCEHLPKFLNAPNINVTIGNQSDNKFWESFFSKLDFTFDIIIDDGGHHMDQQITTFECTFPHLSRGGVYFCEDTHTSYMKEYGGDLNRSNTFMNYIKNYLDKLHFHHFDYKLNSKYPINGIETIHFYDSLTVIRKFQNESFIPISSKR